MTIVLTHALKILLQALLVPNPGIRVEDFIFDKIEKKKPQRLSNIEYLGEKIEGKLQ
jgi:endophilin-B